MSGSGRAEKSAGRPLAGRLLAGRQLEVLSLAARGLSNLEMAEEMDISEATVKRHLSNLYKKLGVHSRLAAVAEAAREGRLSSDEFVGGWGEIGRWRCADEECGCEVIMLCGPSGGAPPWRPPVCHGREMFRVSGVPPRPHDN